MQKIKNQKFYYGGVMHKNHTIHNNHIWIDTLQQFLRSNRIKEIFLLLLGLLSMVSAIIFVSRLPIESVDIRKVSQSKLIKNDITFLSEDNIKIFEKLTRYGITDNRVKYSLAMQGYTPEMLTNLNKLGIDFRTKDSGDSYSKKLVVISDCIVVGTIKEIRYDRRFNALFHTHNIVDVDKYIKIPSNYGDIAKKDVVIVQDSGPLEDGSIIEVEGVLKFNVGEKYIFYLSHNRLDMYKSLRDNADSFIPTNYFSFIGLQRINHGNVQCSASRMVNLNDYISKRIQPIVTYLN